MSLLSSRPAIHPPRDATLRRGRFRRCVSAVAVALWVATMPVPALAGVRVGVTPGALADSIRVAAAEAQRQGLDVQVVEFADWTMPNVALANGDLDVNYFQHQAFLDIPTRETGFPLRSVGLGLLPRIGHYAERHATLGAVPEGTKVAVASDPVNQGRGLLLQAAGLITLRDGVGAKATLDDVAANPTRLRFVEVEGPQLVRAVADVDLAQGYPAHFVSAGSGDAAGRALIYSGADELAYAIRFVARVDRTDEPEIARFVALYQASPSVRARIDAAYAHNPALYTLPWLDRAVARQSSTR